VLILSRPSGIILRSAGALFPVVAPSTPALPSAPTKEGTEPEAEAANGSASLTNELARAYAKMATRLVESVGSEVRGVEEGVCRSLLS
jgi:dynein light chain roadblock-type